MSSVSEADLENQLHNGPFYDEDHSPSGNPTDQQIESFLSAISLGATMGLTVSAGVGAYLTGAEAELAPPFMKIVSPYATGVPVLFEGEIMSEAALLQAARSGQAIGLTTEAINNFMLNSFYQAQLDAGLEAAAALVAAEAEAATVTAAAAAILGAATEVQAQLILDGAAKNEQASLAVFFTSGLG